MCLQLPANQITAITGPSGSGKSTLMNIIGCLDSPTSGTFILDGCDVSDLSDIELSRLRNHFVGFVFQTFNLLPRATALNNVEVPLIYAGVRAGERRRRATGVLERVGLADRMHHRPSELSGGQRQRVAIARALVNEPSVVLADEPTGNLDRETGAMVMDLLFDLQREHNTTLVLVTHDEILASRCDRSIHMVDGQLKDSKGEAA